MNVVSPSQTADGSIKREDCLTQVDLSLETRRLEVRPKEAKAYILALGPLRQVWYCIVHLEQFSIEFTWASVCKDRQVLLWSACCSGAGGEVLKDIVWSYRSSRKNYLRS